MIVNSASAPMVHRRRAWQSGRVKRHSQGSANKPGGGAAKIAGAYPGGGRPAPRPFRWEKRETAQVNNPQ